MKLNAILISLSLLFSQRDSNSNKWSAFQETSRYNLVVELILADCTYLDSLQLLYSDQHVIGFNLNSNLISFTPPLNYPGLLKDVFGVKKMSEVTNVMYLIPDSNQMVEDSLIVKMNGLNCNDEGVKLNVHLSPILRNVIRVIVSSDSVYANTLTAGEGVEYYFWFKSNGQVATFKHPISFN